MDKIQVGQLYKLKVNYILNFLDEFGTHIDFLKQNENILCLENSPKNRGSRTWYKFLYNNNIIFIDIWQVENLQEVKIDD